MPRYARFALGIFLVGLLTWLGCCAYVVTRIRLPVDETVPIVKSRKVTVPFRLNSASWYHVNIESDREPYRESTPDSRPVSWRVLRGEHAIASGQGAVLKRYYDGAMAFGGYLCGFGAGPGEYVLEVDATTLGGATLQVHAWDIDRSLDEWLSWAFRLFLALSVVAAYTALVPAIAESRRAVVPTGFPVRSAGRIAFARASMFGRVGSLVWVLVFLCALVGYVMVWGPIGAEGDSGVAGAAVVDVYARARSRGTRRDSHERAGGCLVSATECADGGGGAASTGLSGSGEWGQRSGFPARG